MDRLQSIIENRQYSDLGGEALEGFAHLLEADQRFGIALTGNFKHSPGT